MRALYPPGDLCLIFFPSIPFSRGRFLYIYALLGFMFLFIYLFFVFILFSLSRTTVARAAPPPVIQLPLSRPRCLFLARALPHLTTTTRRHNIITGIHQFRAPVPVPARRTLIAFRKCGAVYSMGPHFYFMRLHLSVSVCRRTW